MSWPAALNTKTRRVFALFALAEIALIVAVPFLAVAGAYSILDSRSGVFVRQVGPDDPGWSARIDGTTVSLFVQRYEAETVGVVLAASEVGVPGGSIVVFGADTLVGESTLAELEPEEIPSALSNALRIRIDESAVLDSETWPQLVGDDAYEIANPDLVVTSEGTQFEVGEVTVDASNVAAFVGSKPPDVDSNILLPRQKLLWEALVASPPDSDHMGSVSLRSVSGGFVDAFTVPEQSEEQDTVLDADSAEEVVRRAVPFPAGALPAHRVRLRIVDGNGSHDLTAIAAELAAEGIEIVEVANADEFSEGPTQLVMPPEWTGADVSELQEFADAELIIDEAQASSSVATLYIGSEFALESN